MEEDGATMIVAAGRPASDDGEEGVSVPESWTFFQGFDSPGGDLFRLHFDPHSQAGPLSQLLEAADKVGASRSPWRLCAPSIHPSAHALVCPALRMHSCVRPSACTRVSGPPHALLCPALRMHSYVRPSACTRCPALRMHSCVRPSACTRMSGPPHALVCAAPHALVCAAPHALVCPALRMRSCVRLRMHSYVRPSTCTRMSGPPHALVCPALRMRSCVRLRMHSYVRPFVRSSNAQSIPSQPTHPCIHPSTVFRSIPSDLNTRVHRYILPPIQQASINSQTSKSMLPCQPPPVLLLWHHSVMTELPARGRHAMCSSSCQWVCCAVECVILHGHSGGLRHDVAELACRSARQRSCIHPLPALCPPLHQP
eukprot:365044-Chlamydomonas_euryale.AAC.3